MKQMQYNAQNIKKVEKQVGGTLFAELCGQDMQALPPLFILF